MMIILRLRPSLVATALFRRFIETESRSLLFFGYLIESAMMLLAVFTEANWEVKTER